MPYKCTKAKIPRKFDKRVKLTEDDKHNIREMYRQGETVRGVARIFEGKCSRRMVQFVLFPERAEVAKQNFKRWRKENPPKTEDINRYMRVHRKHKVKLHVSGVLKFPFYCRVFYRKTDFKTSKRFVFATIKEAKRTGTYHALRGRYCQVGELEGHVIAGPYSQEKMLLEYGLQNKGRKYWAERYAKKKETKK